MAKVPNSKPQLSPSDVKKILAFKAIDRKKFPVCVLAVRGYYQDTMGVVGKNDRGIWDDAAFTDSPTLSSSVNWNTDPSSYRKGSGEGAKKGMITLKPGIYDYKIGKHKGKGPAGREAGPIVGIRDGIHGDYEVQDDPFNKDPKKRTEFAVNLHWGGNGTSSAGCQTAPPSQWPSFINPLVAELARYNVAVFKYVLITKDEMDAILSLKPQIISVVSAAPPRVELPIIGDTDLSPALRLIKASEGCFLKAYKDPVGIATIGWGTVNYPCGAAVKMGDTCTQAQADFWLLHEAQLKLNSIKALVKVPLNNNEQCALVSFVYNVGRSGFASSTLLKKLNAKRAKLEVGKEFGRWVKATDKKGVKITLPGLVTRREKERILFLS